MKLTDEDIELIIRLIVERLGPQAQSEKVKSLTEETIRQLSAATPESTQPDESKQGEGRYLIVNAFGPAKEGLEKSLRSFLDGNNLPLVALSSNNVVQFRSLIAIINCSDYKSDINKLKFELSELCGKSGFKAIIQSGEYYGVP
jgi:hypothetical protein